MTKDVYIFYRYCTGKGQAGEGDGRNEDCTRAHRTGGIGTRIRAQVQNVDSMATVKVRERSTED